MALAKAPKRSVKSAAPGLGRRPYRVALHPMGGSRLTTVLLVVYLVVQTFYLVWRISIVNWDVWYGPFVLGLELYNALMTTLFLWITRQISRPIYRPTKLAKTVDAFIPTYNEPLSILGPTVQAALGIRGIRNVFVLDDGNRPEVGEMTRSLGAAYYPRTSNLHAKAGNMNNGLLHSDAEFLVCLDADHIAEPQFLERTLGYFDDLDLAFVQTPQTFYNRESFLFRKTKRGLWFEQGTFYDVLQPAKNRSNSAFFVGTSALLRRKAIDSVGGFATGTATEDIHTSLRLHAAGWKSVFIPEALAYGLEAENFKEYYRQRRRWAAGSLGLLLRSVDSPLRARGLSFAQRANYLSATLAHLLGVQKLFYFILPVVCILSLTSPITISWVFASQILVLYAAFSIFLTYLFSRGTYHLVYTEAYNLSNLLAHITGLWGIVKVQTKFSVSKKVVVRSERTWLKGVWWLMLIIGVVTTYRGIVLLQSVGVQHSGLFGLVAVSLVFLVYNLGILMSFFGYLLVYERRESGRERLTPASASINKAPPLSVRPSRMEPVFGEALPRHRSDRSQV